MRWRRRPDDDFAREIQSHASAPGATVAVLSDEGWTRLFDRDPGVLGEVVELNGQRLGVVGVLSPEFSALDDTPRESSCRSRCSALALIAVATAAAAFVPAWRAARVNSAETLRADA